MTRRVHVLALLSLAYAVSGVGVARAQTFPDRPIRVIVPFAAGGNVDIVARRICARLGERLGQPVLVENRTGAAGNIGTQYVVSMPADGHTLLWGVVSNVAINASLYKSLPYDIRRDLAPVGLVVQVPSVIVVSNDIPVRTVSDFIAYAKNRPGLSFASAGVGSSGHLTSELFSAAAGLQLNHVPYRGTAAAYPDLMSGRVAMMADGVMSPMVTSGKVRALAIASSKRSPVAPDVPTLEEVGMKGIDTSAWMGLLAPAGTPSSRILRLNAAIGEVLREPAILEEFRKAGAEPLGGSPTVFDVLIRAELLRWQGVVSKLGVQAG